MIPRDARVPEDEHVPSPGRASRQPPDGPPNGTARRWQLSTVIALLSVSVAVVFNALQAQQGNEQQRLASQALGLQLLTQLSERATESLQPVFAKDFAGKDLKKDTVARGQFLRAASDQNYLAYLFNHEFIQLRDAKEQWLSDMTCTWLYLEESLEPQTRRWYPELEKITRHGSCNGPTGELRRDE